MTENEKLREMLAKADKWLALFSVQPVILTKTGAANLNAFRDRLEAALAQAPRTMSEDQIGHEEIREDKLLKAEREVVTHLQKVIDRYDLTDMEVLEMLHRLVGVGISRIKGDCAEGDS